MTGQVFWLVHVVLLLLSLLGFVCLALTMIRHQEDLFGKALNAPLTRSLRVAGWLLLLLSLWLAAASMGWGFGLTVYSGHTSAAAGLVFIALLVESSIRERKRDRRKANAAANPEDQRKSVF